MDNKKEKNKASQLHHAILLMLALLLVTLIPTVSAFEFDNVKEYNSNTRTATIINAYNFLGLGRDLGTAILKSPKSVKVAVGEDILVGEYDWKQTDEGTETFGKMFLTDMKNRKAIKRNGQYKVLTYKNVLIDDYKTICEETISTNGTIEKSCKQIEIGNHWEVHEEWKPIKSDTLFLADVTYRIGIFVDTEEGDHGDWRPTILGVQVPEWAEWIVGDATYSGQKISISGESSALGLSFSSDGTKMYVVGYNNLSVLQYALSSEWNVSTAIFSKSFVYSGQIAHAYGIHFKSDGTKMYILHGGGGNTVYQYSLSSAWDVSSASYDTVNKAIHANSASLFFSSDGTRMYANDRDNNNVWQYNLSSAWVVSSAGTGISFSISSEFTAGGTLGLSFKTDGTKMYVTDGGPDTVFQYSLSSAWNVSSASYDTVNYDASAQDSAMTDSFFSSDGSQMYIIGQTTNFVYQYNMTAFISDTAPTTTLISPINNSNYTLSPQSVDFICYGSDGQNFTEMEFYLDESLTQTNSSGINNTNYIFTESLTDGAYNWSCIGNDNNSAQTESETWFLTVDTTPFINWTTPPTPNNGTNTTLSTITVNVTLTETYFENITFYIYNSSGLYQSATYTDSTRQHNFTSLTEDTYYINSTVWTNTIQSNSTETREILVDSAIPNITNLLPNSTQDFIFKGNSQNVTWNISDTNLDSCWINYNGTNITVTCLNNLTQIVIQNHSTNILTFYANDTFGNLAQDTIFWNYKIFENNQTYSNDTTEGNLEDFSSIINVLSSLTVSQSILIHNGTQYTGESFLVGDLTTIRKLNLLIPKISADTNITFYWDITLSDDTQINLTTHNQTVYDLALDNCSVYTNKILNLTLYDEEIQNKINSSAVDVELEIAVNIYSSDRTTLILNLSNQYDTNPTAICLSKNLSGSSSYSMDSTIRYTSTGYANEYYNIVKLILTNDTETQNIKLYNLNFSDSTEFQLTFIGGDYIAVEKALVYVERQYIAENTFKTVELPLTDTNGQTIIHLVKNDIIYNFRIVKDGSVLGSFNNMIAFCEDFTIGDCKINLNAFDSVQEIFNPDIFGITFTTPVYNETQDKVSFNFLAVDGTTKTVLMEVTRNDIFGNRSVCNSTLVSSGGTISCNIDPNIDESVLRINIYVDELQISTDTVKLDTSGYGEGGYLVFFIMAITIILMFSGSKTGILIGIILSFAAAIGLNIITSDLIGVGASGLWLLVIIFISIWKLNKERIQ